MSDGKPEAPSKERLAEIYSASPGGKIDVPDPGEMDQDVYDQEIARGRTPEFAKEQAEHAAHVRKVYTRSRSRGAMHP